jgi:enoyl-CoA hydratase
MDVEVAGGVTIVRINHPPVNAFDLALVEDAADTLRGVDGPVVLTGAGSCFSAAFLAVFDHPAPVVAAINGHAIAGGCVLAMAADMRLMSGGKIGLTELSVGVPYPVAAIEICRYAMGPSVNRAALEADNIDAQSALARGWIDEVVATGDLLPHAIAVAGALGQHLPSAYALTKRQLHRQARDAIEAGAEIDEWVLAGWKSDETRARIASFIEALK